MHTLRDTAQLALDTLLQKPVRGIPAWLINPMEWAMIDRLAGAPPGAYQRAPLPTYRQMLINSGCCLLDQWIPENPLTLGATGFEAGAQRSATTGAATIMLDNIHIDGPEAVVDHLERVEFPRIRRAIATFDQAQTAADICEQERAIQTLLGPSMLKAPYAYVKFPTLRYSQYGYENYFMAYALYPEVIERDFALQADLAVLHNRAFVQACREGNLPPLIRLDHDMAGALLKHILAGSPLENFTQPQHCQ